MTITERILELIKNSGKKPSEIADSTGIDRASFTRWKQKDYKPSIDAIISLSQFFNISTDYILTGNESSNNLTLSADQEKALSYYDRLNEENKDYIKGEMVRLYKEQAIESKDEISSTLEKHA